MQIQKGHGEETSSKMFIHCTNGSATVAIARGDVCRFDLADNRAETGINRSTWGTRVLKTATNDLGTGLFGTCVAGVAEQAGPVTPANYTRQDSFLVQVYGYHDAVSITGNTVTKQLVGLSNVAGAAIDTGTSATNTVLELMSAIGVTPLTATAPGTAPVILKGIL